MQIELKIYIEKLKNGDTTALKYIYDLYHAHVYSICKKMTNDNHYAEDITSQIFITLWKKRTILDTEYPIIGIINKITRDLVANHFKKVIREKSNLAKYLQEKPDNIQSSIESNLIFQIYLQIAKKAIEEMPLKRGEIFELYFYKNLSYTEIATHLAIQESTVRVQIHKALDYLRKYITSHPDFND